VNDDQCPACPILVRDLHATAHNALNAIDAALRGDGDWSRAKRKIEGLRASVKAFQPTVDAHFADRAHSHPSGK